MMIGSRNQTTDESVLTSQRGDALAAGDQHRRRDGPDERARQDVPQALAPSGRHEHVGGGKP